MNSSADEQPMRLWRVGKESTDFFRAGLLNGEVKCLIEMTFQGELNRIPLTPIKIASSSRIFKQEVTVEHVERSFDGGRE